MRINIKHGEKKKKNKNVIFDNLEFSNRPTLQNVIPSYYRMHEYCVIDKKQNEIVKQNENLNSNLNSTKQIISQRNLIIQQKVSFIF